MYIGFVGVYEFPAWRLNSIPYIYVYFLLSNFGFRFRHGDIMNVSVFIILQFYLC